MGEVGVFFTEGTVTISVLYIWIPEHLRLPLDIQVSRSLTVILHNLLDILTNTGLKTGGRE